MSKKLWQVLGSAVALLFWLVVSAPAQAQPSNDDFVNARALRHNGSSAYMTSGYRFGYTSSATDEDGEPYHYGRDWGGKSVWYYWVAPASGVATFSTAGSQFDTLLAAYTGSSLRSLARVASNDDSIGLASQIRFSAVAGRGYYLVVDGHNSTNISSRAASGYYRLNVSAPSATTPPVTSRPFNDNFASAWALRAASGAYATSGYVRHTNLNATREYGEPLHAGASGGKSVWYVWVAPSNGTLTLSTAGSTFDTVLGVYSGTSVRTITTLASNDDYGSGNTSRVALRVTAGRAYRIAVGSFGSSAGIFYLRLGFVPGSNPGA